MLRASSLHLSPFVFHSPSSIVTLLRALILRRKPLSLFHHRASHSLPIFRPNYSICSTKFSRMPAQSRILHATASLSSGSSSEAGRELLVQHLLIKEDDQKLLLELQKRAADGEDLSDLAVEYSICPSKEQGGMLGWVRKGQMVPEFEEAAFNAQLNKVVRCKTKFGWHLLQVLSEREESVLEQIQPSELHEKMQDPSFLEEAQLIDVREPDEVTKASLSGFKVLPLCQFGNWGPEITTKFDSEKDTYVMESVSSMLENDKKASFSSRSSSEAGREVLVQQLLINEDDHKLLLELHKRAADEDLRDLAVEYSMCPSKEEGPMLGWVRKGQMVPEFEEAAFNAPLDKVVRCKSKLGWHLLRVLSEREESVLEIQPNEFHEKNQDTLFFNEAQLIDVREPDQVYVHEDYRKVLSLFDQSVDMGLVPLGPMSDRLLQTLVKNKEYKMAYSVYKEMIYAGGFPRYLSLSALVECLVQLCKPKLALGGIGLMLKKGYSINLYVANIVLNGLCCSGFAVEAEVFLDQMDRNSMSPDRVSFNTLIKGLCREKRLDKTVSVKKKMESANITPNLITYNILIDAHFMEGRVDEALRLWEEMRMKGLEPDAVFYGTLINGFCCKGDVDRGKEIMNEMLGKGISPNRVIYTCLLRGLCQKGNLKEAKQLFNDMIRNGIRPDVVTFTGMIGGLCQLGRTEKAVELFNFMVDKGEEPNGTTYNILIDGLCKAGLFNDAFKILEMMVEKGKNPNIVTYNTVLRGLCDLGKVDVAMKLFDSMLNIKCIQPDSWTISTLVKGLCREGHLDKAEKINRVMIEQNKPTDVAPYTILIGAYLKVRNIKKAVNLWKEFLQLGLIPDSRTYSALINGLCRCNCVNIAKGIFTKMRMSGPSLTLIDYNTLMAALCKESSLEQARALFRDMVGGSCKPDVVSYNIMIDSTIKAGDIESANELLVDMQLRGLRPDALTFSVLINRFSKLGLMEEAKSLFERMKASGYPPHTCVYDSLLKGFKAEGNTEEIICLLQKMGTEGVALDDELTSTILKCICDLPQGHDVAKLLPSFTQEKLKGSSIPCDELLARLQSIVPMLQTSASQPLQL